MATKAEVLLKAKQRRHAPYSKAKPPPQTCSSSSEEKLPDTGSQDCSQDDVDSLKGQGDQNLLGHETYPCISARQPYAGLILNGLKTIETRWTPVFEKLEGRTVAIHVAWKDWDGEEWRTMLQMEHGEGKINQFIKDGEKHGRAVVAGLVDIGETWQCSAVGDEDQITEWEKNSLLRPLHEKYLTRLSNPRWLKRPLQVRGQRGIWEVNIPLNFL
ncbi:protein EOLA1-like [Asterias amurensis]|uniref:protein EOLA1-like n=1 Tax=Asterias amurensis TaxID=7602 RepID=UPI003AB6FCD7